MKSMMVLKRWEGEVRDCGSRKIGDFGLFRCQICKCVRYDGESTAILHIGKTLRECHKFREEFIRDGCFCWTEKKLCFDVPICPLHPYGMCGMDMEMRRTRTEMDGDMMLVFYTVAFYGYKELIAKVRPDCSIEYFGELRTDLDYDAFVARLESEQ